MPNGLSDSLKWTIIISILSTDTANQTMKYEHFLVCILLIRDLSKCDRGLSVKQVSL